MKRIEVPTDSVPELEQCDTTADIQHFREERRQDKGRKRHIKRRRRRPGGGNALSRGGSGRRACKDRQKVHRTGYMHRGWRRYGHISVTLKTKKGHTTPG